MKATMTSTTAIVEVSRTGNVRARVWEGVTERGVPFTAYIVTCQVRNTQDVQEFERDLQEHKQPEVETQRAIDLRYII